jgi:hypothetical protein
MTRRQLRNKAQNIEVKVIVRVVIAPLMRRG